MPRLRFLHPSAGLELEKRGIHPPIWSFIGRFHYLRLFAWLLLVLISASLINLSQNLDSYSFYSDVHTEEDLGRMYLQELEAAQVPEHLIDYIDYEAYGRDARINEGGHFAPGGYVQGGHSFKEHYHGIEDIPDEHRVFSMPKVPIREQMAAYQEMANRASLTTERSAPKVDREER